LQQLPLLHSRIIRRADNIFVTDIKSTLFIINIAFKVRNNAHNTTEQSVSCHYCVVSTYTTSSSSSSLSRFQFLGSTVTKKSPSVPVLFHLRPFLPPLFYISHYLVHPPGSWSASWSSSPQLHLQRPLWYPLVCHAHDMTLPL
jgi:hypothetical protein